MGKTEEGALVMNAFVPEKLLAEGWKRQSVASEPRLSEAVELYQSLGLEVLLVPVLQETGGGGGRGCSECFDAADARVIYTRPRAGGEERE